MRDTVNFRQYVAGLLVVVLVGSAGCTVLSPGDVDQEALREDVTYEWNTGVNGTITVGDGEYQAVYNISNRSEVRLFEFDRFNNERPIDPQGVKFQFPNGTVVGADWLGVEKTRSFTVITLPATHGKFAYSGPTSGKHVRVPTVISGSHELILPEDAQIQYPLFGRVLPRDYEWELEEGQVHIFWEDVQTDQIIVRYYLVRDLWLFGGIVGIAFLVLIGGGVYLWRELQEVRERRGEVGLFSDDE